MFGNSAADPNNTEEIRLELLDCIFNSGILNCARERITGAVSYDVDAAAFFKDQLQAFVTHSPEATSIDSHSNEGFDTGAVLLAPIRGSPVPKVSA